ncbi:MAG: cell division protein FtsZ [Brevinema sp.]
MSYFEELWSAGKEDPQDIFSVLNDPQIQNTPNLGTQEEVFYTPQNLVQTPNIVQKDIPKDIFEENIIKEEEPSNSMLTVLGVGGAGCNAVNRMIEDNVSGVEFVAINTDIQVLKKSLAKKYIPIGTKITKGLGAGAKPEIGEKAAIESSEEIRNVLKNTDMVFITAGMGGGTGTGAAPVIAQIAKESGCLVVAVVTLPFSFEGTKRHKTALEGIDKLKDHVDTMLVISNSRIFEIVEKNTSVKDAFKKIDEVLKQAVQGISGIISETAIINVDFNDVKTILANRGEAIMGIGQAKGDGRALKAAQEALANPLIENNTFRQSGAMVAKIIGGSDFDMKEFHEAAEVIAQFCRPDAEIIMGLDFDENLRDQVRIIIVATDLIREKPKVIEQVPQATHIFSTIEDLQKMHGLEPELPTQNYIDRDEDWGLTQPRKAMISEEQSFLGERRSIDFSLRKEDPRIQKDFDPSEARRSVSDVPPMISDLDTPAFLRRRKKIHTDSNY